MSAVHWKVQLRCGPCPATNPQVGSWHHECFKYGTTMKIYTQLDLSFTRWFFDLDAFNRPEQKLS